MKGKIAVNTECMPLYGPRLTQLVRSIAQGEDPGKRLYVAEQQFSALEEPENTVIGGKEYPVTVLTRELMDERSY